jgi:hypothetical protein
MSLRLSGPAVVLGVPSAKRAEESQRALQEIQTTGAANPKL